MYMMVLQRRLLHLKFQARAFSAKPFTAGVQPSDEEVSARQVVEADGHCIEVCGIEILAPRKSRRKRTT